MNIRRFKNRCFLFAQKTIVFLLLFVLLFSDVQSVLHAPFLPSVEKAHASTGDFSIFSENTGTETVDTSALDVSWDTSVSASGNIALQGNNSDIDLSEGGKYLVTYNVWTEQGTSTSGTQRRSMHSWLTLAGSELEYGHGGGYLRDSDNVLEAYVNGAAIIDVTAGDDLQVHITRDDANTGAGANIRPATNGVSVLKLKDSWDYLRIHKSATSSDITGNTSFTDVTWDTSDEVDTGSFGFSPTSANITLKGDDDDHFLVTANIRLEKTVSDATRENYEMMLTLDGAEIPGTRVTAFMRGNSNGNDIFNDTLVYTGIIQKDAIGDQTLNVEVRRESTGSPGATVIVADDAAISIVALPDEGSYIMLGSDTTTALASTRTGFGWNTQTEVDSGAFSHSTTTSNSQIDIDTAGDYLFFSTMYALTSSNDRQPQRIDWRKNGSSVLGYGGHGAFNRGNATFSSGSSGGLIMDTLSATDYIEVTHFDETEAPANSTFQANRVAVQGILLDDNFFGTDMFVSATGTHAVETDIPTTNFYGGGGFVIEEKSGSRNLTSVRITESGTVDAKEGLSNVELWYDLDETAPYDCTGESYDGDETQFEVASKEFNAANGSVAFSDSVQITTTKTLCAYPVYDVVASSTDGQTVLISIDDPSADVAGSGTPTVGPPTSVAPAASTTLRNAEITQTHYNWRNDNGSETTATSIEGTEDTSAIGFANGTTRRLRFAVSAEGSTSSPAVQYRLEYAQKITTCSAVGSWTDVGTGGDWDVVNTGNLTDGNDTTNVVLQINGGVTDPSGGSFISPNGGQKDTSSQTGNITFSNGDFTELEYAIEPNVSAPQGNTYCFRVSDAGTSLRNYDVYAEGTISADIDVSASSSQVATLDLGSTGQYIGGTFVIERPGTSRTLTSITITESGTVDAENNLANPRLYYDLDTTTPFDCTGESYSGGETNVAGTAFSSANGTSSFTGLSISLTSTQSLCGYIVLDVGSGAADGDTINIEIGDPSTDVVVTTSSVGPSTAVSPIGSTTVAGPVLTQTHYHWRNDDGDETDTGATSASGGVEDTAILAVPKESTRRIRLQVSNEGSVTSASTQYILEYGTKVTTCENVGSWINVGAVGGAFDMSLSSNISDGNTTDIDNAGNGAMTEENTTFVGTGALRETEATSSAMALTSSQYTELEYSIEVTADAGDDTNYCFRVSDGGVSLNTYTEYPELTTREKQDFFIQRGTEQVSGTSLTLTAGLDYTAPSATSSAFIRISNSGLSGAGNAVGGGNTNMDDFTAYISDQSDITSSFTIARPSAATSDTRVSWEVIEFVGIPATDNEMIVRGVGQLSLTATNLVATGTAVTGIVDDADVVVFITGQYNDDAGRTNANDGMFTSFWHGTSSVPVLSRAEGDVGAGVSYAVVEFIGVNWSVERVEHVYSAAATTETESITALPSITQAFVHAQKRVANDNGLDEQGHQVWISSIGAVSFRLRTAASTPASHTSVAWVISNTQTGDGALSSNQSSGSIASGGPEPNSNSIGIGATVNIANSSIFATNDSGGTGTAYPRGFNSYTITSATTYELWQSDTGQANDYRVEVLEWPVAEISIRQNYYRFYADNDLLDPTDPYPAGASDLGENTSITGGDDPLGETDRVRIRMTLLINNATLPQSVQSFKLQYGKRITSCSAVGGWSDLGDPGSASIWRGYNGSVADGVELATSTPAPGTLNISVSDIAGTYEEQNASAVNPYAVDLGEDIEYDWLIEHNGATQLSDYCFRMVENDGTVLDGYNNYPTLRTTGYTPVVANWRWYDDATSTTPVSPLANENVTPIDVVPDNEVKLRVTAAEVEGAPGTNVKFRLQYSEHPDFSAGVYDLDAVGQCNATSTWCYVDGAGVDNAVIDSALLTDADSCVAGVGDGCGLHNEIATTTTTHAQPSFSKMEFEFTLKASNPRVSAVYYFRLYDVTNDVSVGASSSYPSLQMEGASLVFTLAGLDSGTTVGSVVTDATTTASTIIFDEIPFDTEHEAAHRLTIDTNATEGYQMLMYSDQNLTDSYGATIPTVTGTNAVPSGWATGCIASAKACFGYHSTDPLLQGSSARFGADDSYAAFSTTPEEIMYSSLPAAESHDMVYKIQVGQEQPAGQYEKTITYIAVPIF